ncbi:MAG: type 2 isopentenyl-diphosphate Delta-isomerase [Alphaproteobacteria bacterium]|nr:type 2 isopentenyl-diphosphate Delta-isomerase [Alphaproteobacteria bacterium]
MAADDRGRPGGTTEARKRAHIETVLNEDVAAKGVTTGFERFFFEHAALPETDLDAVDLSTTVLGRRLAAPFLISSMTGGTEPARAINRHLAEAAQRLGIAMGLGSQRAAIERADLAATYRVRDVAPDILLFANIGAVQLTLGYGLDEARRAVDMIGADALFLHLNPLQEAVQAGGDRAWSGVLARIETLCRALPVPVAVKEVGNGISGALARRLDEAGVAAIDVAGAGGTSWSEVEAHRQPDPRVRRIAHAFAGWGIPTALALIETVAAVPDRPVFASGGIRTGIDAAKAIRLGAALVGTAAPVLAGATATADAVAARVQDLIDALRIAAFCAGAGDLAQLRRAPLRRVDDWSVVA